MKVTPFTFYLKIPLIHMLLMIYLKYLIGWLINTLMDYCMLKYFYVMIMWNTSEVFSRLKFTKQNRNIPLFIP